MNTNTANSKRTIAPLSDMSFFTEDSIQQAAHYKRFRLSDGVRTIWIPLDESRFDFVEPMQLFDRAETLTLNSGSDIFTGVGAGDGFRAFIFPSKFSNNLSGAIAYQSYVPPGAHDNMKYNDPQKAHRQDNDDLHGKVRIEWGINFVGLNQACPVRIYINQYYETVPHESQMDNYFPTKGPRGNSDTSIKMIQTVAGDITPTPSKTSFTGVVGNVLNKLLDVASGFVAGGPVGGMTAAAKQIFGGGIGGQVQGLLSGLMRGPVGVLGDTVGQGLQMAKQSPGVEVMSYKSRRN